MTRLPISSESLTILGAARLAWRSRGQLAGMVVIGAAVGALGSAVWPSKYEAHTSFLSVGGTSIRLPASLGGLAGAAQASGLAGLLGGGESQSLSPYFFGDVITSDAVLFQVVRSTFPVPGTDSSAHQTLIALLGAGGRTPTDSLVRASQRLRKALTIEIQSRTGVVTITYSARDPDLARAVLVRLTELLNIFVRRDLQTRAGDQRRFLEARLASVRDSVSAQQRILQTFLEGNRDYRNAPGLTFRETQLRQELEFRKDLASGLARSLEESRLNELRDLPLLSIIDQPIRPPRPSSPKPLLTTLGLAALAPLLWLAWLLFAQSGRPEDSHSMTPHSLPR